MTDKIVLVQHHAEPKDDRITAYLKGAGYLLDWRSPFAGDDFSDLDANIKGSVVYGGTQNVFDINHCDYLQDEINWIKFCIQREIPLLGICLGAQLIAYSLGATVRPHIDGRFEFGYYPIYATEKGKYLFPKKLVVTQAHHQFFDIPMGATLLATGDLFPNQAFQYGKQAFALQFHPEITISGFKNWQNADWPDWQAPGVQAKEEQNKLMVEHDAEQEIWFFNFLARLF